MNLALKPHRETETYVVSGVEDIQLLLDDHIVKTQSMRSSPFIKPIEEDVVSAIISFTLNRVHPDKIK